MSAGTSNLYTTCARVQVRVPSTYYKSVYITARTVKLDAKQRNHILNLIEPSGDLIINRLNN